MTTPPLDLPALRETAEAATPGPWGQWNPSVGESHITIANKVAWRSLESATPFADDDAIPHWADARHIAAFDPPTVLALLDRVEAAEATAHILNISRESWIDRAEAAEKKVAAVLALAQKYMVHPNYPSSLEMAKEDVAYQVIQALGGEHTKQLGGTPTGEFADVCSCGKSYWPCDSLDGGA